MLRKSLFLRLFLSYVFLIILVVLAGAAVQIKVISILTEDSTKLFNTTVESAVQIIDEQIKQADNAAVRIGSDFRINTLYRLQPPLSKEEYFDLYQAKTAIESSMIMESLVVERFVLVHDNGIVVGSQFATPDFTTRHEESLKYDNLTNQDFLNLAFSGSQSLSYWPMKEVQIHGVSHSCITHIRSLPIPTIGEKEAVVVTLLDVDLIEELFRPILDMGGRINIVDITNTVMISYPSILVKAEIAAEITSFQFYAPTAGWQIEATLPNEIIQKRVREITSIYRTMTIIAAFLSLIFASLFTYKNVLPIHSILKMLGINVPLINSSVRPYESLQESVSNLVSNNEDLKQRVENQQILMRDSFIRRLLSGVHMEDQWFGPMAAAVGIPEELSSFAVLVFKIEGYGQGTRESLPMALQELDIARVSIEQAVKARFPISFFHHDTPEMAIAIISPCPSLENNRAELAAYIEEIRTHVSQRNVVFSVGIGCRLSQLRKASVSYHDALKAVESARFAETLWYDEIRPDMHTLFYPLHMQQSLIQQSLNGNEETVLNILSELWERNLSEGNLHDDDLLQFTYEMRGTIMRLADKAQFEIDGELKKILTAYKEYELNLDTNLLHEKILNFYKYYCRCAGEIQTDKMDHFRKALVDFVDKNIFDSNLGLKMAGVKFGLSEKYLSALFKEQTGENFGNYVEDKRINRASELLASTHMKIKLIAEEVGYQNTNTFYKAFRRRFGTSPRKLTQDLSE